MIEFNEVPPTFLDKIKPAQKDFTELYKLIESLLDDETVKKAYIQTYKTNNVDDIIDIFFSLLNENFFDKFEVNDQLENSINELKVQAKKVFNSCNKVYLESFLIATVSSFIKLLQGIYENNNSTNKA